MMAIRKVTRMGNPILRKVARFLNPEEIPSEEIKRIIIDMLDTMEDYGGIGIAAPQIGESVQIAIIHFDRKSSRYPNRGELPLTIFINPKVTVLDSNEQSYWEGCLSVPDLRGRVTRPSKVSVDYLNIKGEPTKLVTEGFLATVMQHELDHLQGILYIDKVKNTHELAFNAEYDKFALGDEDSEELGE